MLVPSVDADIPIEIGVLSTSPDPLADRRLLIYHPGGPGVSAVAAMFADPPEVDYGVFALATWDGRSSSSVPSGCGPDSEVFGIDRSPANLSTLAPAAAIECMRSVGWRLEPGASGAQAAAEELVRVRQALGFDEFDMLTHSYGTAIGEAFLRMYPGSVARAVLDAPMVLDASWEARIQGVRDAVTHALARLLNCDRSPCGERTADLVSQTEDPYVTLRTAVLDGEPRVGVTSLVLTGTAFDQATLMALRDRALWPAFLNGVESALNGDAAYLWSLGEKYFFGVDRYVYYASMCADIDGPPTLDGYVDQEPLMFAYASEFAPCSSYPTSPPLPSPPIRTKPTVLVIGSPYDVLTPIGLVAPGTWLGSVATLCETAIIGHTSGSSRAVQRTVAAFLEAGILTESSQLSC